eukprot:SAG11_NODE_15634_length_571_cov_1.042373_1_plen_81_part_00
MVSVRSRAAAVAAAPELEGGIALVKGLASRGIIVSSGHSTCDLVSCAALHSLSASRLQQRWFSAACRRHPALSGGGAVGG